MRRGSVRIVNAAEASGVVELWRGAISVLDRVDPDAWLADVRVRHNCIFVIEQRMREVFWVEYSGGSKASDFLDSARQVVSDLCAVAGDPPCCDLR
jgi:hypothetical protein